MLENSQNLRQIWHICSNLLQIIEMPKRTDSPFSDLDAATAQHTNPVVGRLREALRRGGGPKSVSRRTKLPISTIGRFLTGQDMKMQSAVAIAEACGVTVEWLATGKGNNQAPEPSPTGLSMQQAPLRAPPGSPIDVGALAKALEIADMLSAASGQATSYMSKAKRIAANYDLLTMPEEDIPPLPQLPNKDLEV